MEFDVFSVEKNDRRLCDDSQELPERRPKTYSE